MAQKDKIKELVGRGLHSYHTKALQQIDRIEKKNKEQNHKISILSNELDNDYLIKTEEGSVVSLEHSKEGMVYLDELQGNTLVNYCTDGSKELTLNGDIDVEGTFVTTTEGVDNGLVDVMCEGNTLVNLATVKSVTLSGVGSKNISNLTFKSNTKYTIIFDVDSNNVTNESHEGIYLWLTADGTNSSIVSALDLKGRKKYVMTRSDNVNGWGIGCRNNLSGTVILNNILILEGDWTDIETPPYFIGMKSVGQDDENGHKIEILSKNKNLTDIIPSNWEVGSIDGTSGQHVVNTKRIRTKNFMLLPKKQGSLNFKQFGNYKLAIRFYDKDYKMIDGTNTPYQGFIAQPKISIPNMAFYYKLVCASNNEVDIMPNEIVNNQCYLGIEEIPTSYIEPKLNKKEILLNEPLRGLPNGVKDRFVKLGGKLFIERNCSTEFNLADYNFEILNQDDTIIRFRASSNNFSKLKHSNNGVCNILNYHQAYNLNHSSIEGIGIKGDSNYVLINLNKSRNILSVDDLKNFIKNGLVFSDLQTPTYEPLETNPELLVYNDTTHISNNSIIPCNMKIQNSGYNAIIKPSTLYTVALDTNKSGTIGMNLGGAKGTTTNNVLTLTTPATLTDDSLRLYGKGIKGSKVRLLEGDKTNWIPSHFEGMKSSFEDKLQDDGTYKMEILSCNENLFNNDFNERFENGDYVKTSPYIYFPVNVNKNKNYICYIDAKDLPLDAYCNIATRPYYDYPLFTTVFNATTEPNLTATRVVSRTTLDNCNNKIYISLAFNEGNIQQVEEYLKSGKFKVKVVEQGNNLSFIPHKSNKIQFSSIEPLRGVDNTKDRFVFKDNKLMIERNCGYRRLDGTENWTKFNTNTKTVTQFYTDNSKQKHGTMVGTCTTVPWIGGRNANQEKEGLAGGGGAGVYLWLDVFNYKLESLDSNGIKNWLRKNNIDVVFELAEPTYEEIPFELQKIILEGYENGTLFFDTNIPPTSTVTYAGETPIVKATKLNKTEVLNNSTDINDNIIPYLMDMDYRVVCLELATETQGVSMARLFGGVYEMLKRDILSNRYSIDEYKHRLDVYLSANKITNEEYEKLGDMLNE